MYKIVIVGFKIYEESDYNLNLDSLLVISYTNHMFHILEEVV